MARGRPPKSNEQKRAEGNPGKRPLPEPIKVPGHFLRLEEIVEPPDGLNDTAKQWWGDVIPSLYALGLLEKVDLPMLEFAATQYARAVQARRVIDAQGVVSVGSTGQPKEHPLLETERKAHANYLRFIEQFAGTPQARVRLGIAELQRRTLGEELKERLGTPHLEEVDADEELVYDAEVVG